MPSRDSLLITGAPFGIGAVHRVYVARGGSDARPIRWGRMQAKNIFQTAVSADRSKTPRGEKDIRLEERRKERTRIVHELHDTLLQGFLDASLLLQGVEQTPAESPAKPALSRALRLMRWAIDEARAAILRLQAALPALSNLEQAFSSLLEAVTPARGVRVRVFVQGKPRTLKPAIQKQVFLIGREVVMNALRHSKATSM